MCKARLFFLRTMLKQQKKNLNLKTRKLGNKKKQPKNDFTPMNKTI